MPSGNVTFLVVLALAAMLWILYHKIFHVCYFNLGKALIAEVSTCIVLGFVLTELLFRVLGTAALFVLKLLVYGFVAAAALAGLWLLLFLIFLIRRKLNPFQAQQVPEQAGGPLSRSFWAGIGWIGRNPGGAKLLVIAAVMIGGTILFYAIEDVLKNVSAAAGIISPASTLKNLMGS